jgi:hypothetical protein
VQILAAVQSGTPAKLTIPELKCYLKAAALPLKGKKEELFARVQAHVGSAVPSLLLAQQLLPSCQRQPDNCA